MAGAQAPGDGAGGEGEDGDQANSSNAQNPFSSLQQIKIEFPSEIYVFQKDSKTISIFNVPNQTLVHRFVEHKGNFPHNF